MDCVRNNENYKDFRSRRLQSQDFNEVLYLSNNHELKIWNFFVMAATN